MQRRSHQKSRAGCLTCKKNRIKCDESKPICINCSKRERDCKYEAKKTREIKDSATQSGSSTSTSPRTLLSDDLSPDSRLERYYQDSELLTHYIRFTSIELGDGRFWSNDVLDMALKDKMMFHLILSLSSYHLVSLSSSEAADRHLHDAAEHYSLALTPLLDKLDNVAARSAPMLRAAGAVICFISFAKGPEPGQYMVFSDQGSVEWLSLMDGVRTIMLQHPEMSRIDPKMTGEAKITIPTDSMSYREPLAHLRAFIDSTSILDNSIRDTYIQEMDNLEDCYVAKFEGSHKCREDRSNAVMSWVFCLSPLYRQGLERKEPMALVVCAHFAVLLVELGKNWPFRGWPAHILAGVRKHVSPEYHSWLNWPQEIIDNY